MSTDARPKGQQPPLEILLTGLRDHVRPVIRDLAGPRSCLQTTSVVAQVLRGFGYRPLTLGVTFQVYNHVLTEQVLRGEDMDLTAPGAFARRVGGGPPAEGDRAGDGWQGAGHVVTLLVAEGYFVDLAIDQVNDGHPQDPGPRDLHVVPTILRPPRDALMDLRWGRRTMHVVNDQDGPLYMLAYQGVPTDKSYMTAQTYTDPMWTDLANEIVARIKEEL